MTCKVLAFLEFYITFRSALSHSIDGVFAVAYGTCTHLSPTPFVTGAPRLVKLLTQDIERLTVGKIALGDDPVEVAKNIEAHIDAKRKGLGLSTNQAAK